MTTTELQTAIETNQPVTWDDVQGVIADAVAAQAAADAAWHANTIASTNAQLAAKDAEIAAAQVSMQAQVDAALAAKDAELAAALTGAGLSMFELQTIAGAHWPAMAAKIRADAALAASDQAAAVEAAKLAIQTNLDALVTAAEAAHASGNLDAIAAVIAQARSYTTAARRAKIEADLAAAQAAAADAAAKLAAL